MKIFIRFLIAGLYILCVTNYLNADTIGQSVGIASSPNPVGSGARAIGMGGAFIAVADDATAASWNPAGLIQLETPELSIVGAYVQRKEDFYSSIHPESNSKISIDESSINYFSATYPFTWLDRNMVVSINYQRLYDFRRNLDYQLVLTSTTPPPLSITTTSTEHRRYNQDGYLSALGLAYAVQITPRISIGLTMNLWTDRLGWENGWESTYSNHSTTTFGSINVIEDLIIDEKYSGFEGVNLNFGMMWKNKKDNLTLGAVLKTPFKADLHYENTEIYTRDENGIITSNPPIQYSEENELEMPISYGIGASWRFSDNFTIDADVYRTHWSDYTLTNSEGQAFNPIDALPKSQSDVKDTTQVRIGGEYLIINPGKQWVIPIRGGLFYDPEPYTGKIKDFYGISIGSGFGYKRYIFDIAYQFRMGRDVETGTLIKTSNADVNQHTVYASLIYYFE